MACTTVLFDLDGTLTDSQGGIVASFRHTLASFGLAADPAAIRRWIGPPLHEGLAGLGVPADQVEAAVTTYRSYFGTRGLYQNALFEGVPEMLQELGAAGLTLGLATSKLQRFAEEILDHFGIAGHFAVVSGSSRDGSRTTKEEIVAHALASLGQPEPATVALVGDREHDMYAARCHGLRAVGVAWGYGDREELQASGSEVIAEDPGSLTGLLLGGVILPATYFAG